MKTRNDDALRQVDELREHYSFDYSKAKPKGEDQIDFAEVRWCQGMIDLTDASEPRHVLLCMPFLMS